MADAVIVKVFGSEELMQKLHALGNFFEGDTFRGILEDAGQAYVNLAKAEAPISRSPGATGLVSGGALRNSINYQVEEFGTPQVTLRIGAGGPGAGYAQYVEEGTRDSIRMAINRKVMFWMEDGAGRTVNVPWTNGAPTGTGWTAHYRKVVWHPGTRAQPFFFKHAENISTRLMMAITRAINSEFNKLGT
jgi:HK97 gp10 family phage protein